MPSELVKTVAGLALATPMIGALVTAFTGPHETFSPGQTFSAGLTFAVAVSGVSLFAIGAAFWGLIIGLLALGLERALSPGSK